MSKAFKKPSLTLNTQLVADNIPLEVLPKIYIGSIHSSYDLTTLQNYGITHILNCSRLPSAFPNDFNYLSIDIRDKDDSNILSCIPISNIFIEAGIEGGGVLVHCIGGRSRSAAFILAYIMSSTDLAYDEALAIIVGARPVVSINRGFEIQLKAYWRNGFDVYTAQQILLRSRISALSKLRGSSTSIQSILSSIEQKYPKTTCENNSPLLHKTSDSVTPDSASKARDSCETIQSPVVLQKSISLASPVEVKSASSLRHNSDNTFPIPVRRSSRVYSDVNSSPEDPPREDIILPKIFPRPSSLQHESTSNQLTLFKTPRGINTPRCDDSDIALTKFQTPKFQNIYADIELKMDVEVDGADVEDSASVSDSRRSSLSTIITSPTKMLADAKQSKKRSKTEDVGYKSIIREYIPLFDSVTPHIRLSRPGSSSVRIIPPLRGMDRCFHCSWCGTTLFRLANVLRVDSEIAQSLSKPGCFNILSDSRNNVHIPTSTTNVTKNAFEANNDAYSPSAYEPNPPIITNNPPPLMSTRHHQHRKLASMDGDQEEIMTNSIEQYTDEFNLHMSTSINISTTYIQSKPNRVSNLFPRVVPSTTKALTSKARQGRAFDFDVDDHMQLQSAASNDSTQSSDSSHPSLSSTGLNEEFSPHNHDNESLPSTTLPSRRNSRPNMNLEDSLSPSPPIGSRSRRNSRSDQWYDTVGVRPPSGRLTDRLESLQDGIVFASKSRPNSKPNSPDVTSNRRVSLRLTEDIQTDYSITKTVEINDTSISTFEYSPVTPENIIPPVTVAAIKRIQDLKFANNESPRIVVPTHRDFNVGKLVRTQSIEKRRWLERINLLQNGSGKKKLSTLADADEDAEKLALQHEKYIFLEYLDWMGVECFQENVDIGELSCFNCKKVIGSWTWTPTARQSLDNLLGSPIFRVHRHVVHYSEFPLDSTPMNGSFSDSD